MLLSTRSAMAVSSEYPTPRSEADQGRGRGWNNPWSHSGRSVLQRQKEQSGANYQVDPLGEPGRQHRGDFMAPQTRSAVMARIRGKNTGPERAVAGMLAALGLRPDLHARDLPGGPTSHFVTCGSRFLWMATSGMAGDFRLGGSSCRKSGTGRSRGIAFGMREIMRACAAPAGRSCASGSIGGRDPEARWRRGWRLCGLQPRHTALKSLDNVAWHGLALPAHSVTRCAHGRMLGMFCGAAARAGSRPAARPFMPSMAGACCLDIQGQFQLGGRGMRTLTAGSRLSRGRQRSATVFHSEKAGPSGGRRAAPAS